MSYGAKIRTAAARGLNAAGYGSEEDQIDEVLAAIESAGREVTENTAEDWGRRYIVSFPNKEATIEWLDDYADGEDIRTITGCTTGEELYATHLLGDHVPEDDGTHVWVIYKNGDYHAVLDI